MKKSSKVTEEYKRLGGLAQAEMTPQIALEIKRALKGSAGLVASRAAEIVADKGFRDLIPEMIDAYARFAEDGAQTDKGCRAKTAIVNALNAFDYLGDEVFLAGAHYKQMEGSFGPPEDTAVEVRSGCAFGLARINHREAHYVLADLLVDAEKPVRVAAVKAVAYLGMPEGEIMLRLKALCGDKEIEVVGECFIGLMTMAPSRSLEFVSRYLRAYGPGMQESAAIALGSSHLPEALHALKECWEENPFPSVRRSLLLPIALIRGDDAFNFLLAALRDADTRTAAEALGVLNLYPGEQYVARVTEVAEKRAEPEIKARFRQEFDQP